MSAARSIALETRGLVKRFGGLLATDNVSHQASRPACATRSSVRTSNT